MALPPMTNIIFDPAGPLVECVDIFIVRDLLVENDEQFFFLISPTQDDEAVEVGSPSLAPVTIEDEPNGKHDCIPAEIQCFIQKGEKGGYTPSNMKSPHHNFCRPYT